MVPKMHVAFQQSGCTCSAAVLLHVHCIMLAAPMLQATHGSPAAPAGFSCCAPRCSLLFLATVLPSTPWLTRHIPAEQLPLATSLAAASSIHPVRQALELHSTLLRARPAWQLPVRPASAMQQLQLDLKVPALQLQQLVEQGLQAAEAATPAATVSSREAVWCGHRFSLQLEFNSSRKLAVVLMLLPALRASEQQQQLASVQCSLCAVRFGVQEVCKKPDKARTLVAGAGRRWVDFFGLGGISSADAACAVLQSKHGIHSSGGELHVRAVIRRVW